MTVRLKRILFTGLAVLSFPFFLLTLLVGVSLVSPMGFGFLTSFSIKNSSAGTVWVTPIGAVGKQGDRHMLPLFISRFPYRMRTGEFPIEAGKTRSFTYDWDDIQFCDILIRSSGGAYRILPTGLHPTEKQYRRPMETAFVIPALDTLSPAAAIHLRALSSKPKRIFTFYILAIIGLAFPCFTYAAFKAKK